MAAGSDPNKVGTGSGPLIGAGRMGGGQVGEDRAYDLGDRVENGALQTRGMVAGQY